MCFDFATQEVEQENSAVSCSAARDVGPLRQSCHEAAANDGKSIAPF